MVYVLLAEGFEEVEALTPVDILRRAGLPVQTVGITGKTVTGSRGVPVVADVLPEQVQPEQTDLLILPGGLRGTENLRDDPFTGKLIDYCLDNDRYLAAICAAPSIVLGGRGVLRGKKAICYPGMEDGMTGATVVKQAVVQDGKIFTSRGAGTAMDFAFALCAALCGKDKAREIARSIVLPNA
jgi:4-methyl-5(b-hydroxyethyl)-thiazole monophosphate biosynthesis